jgi:hypothetical protein
MGTGACEAETNSTCAGPQQAYVVAGGLASTTLVLCQRHMQDIAKKGYRIRPAPASTVITEGGPSVRTNTIDQQPD